MSCKECHVCDFLKLLSNAKDVESKHIQHTVYFFFEVLIYENVTYLSDLFLEAKFYFFELTIRKCNGLNRKSGDIRCKNVSLDNDKTSSMEGRSKSEVLPFRAFFFKYYDHLGEVACPLFLGNLIQPIS